MSYRRDLDGIRAVAILSVLLFHGFPEAAPGGFIGVDVFFVLSGFLITGIIWPKVIKGTFSIREFYARRIRRIFPALLTVLATALILGWWLFFPHEYKSLGRHTTGASLFLSNFRLWSEAGYFDIASDLKPLLHLWSLSIEEQFYLVWPVLLVGLWWILPSRRGVLLSLAAVLSLSLAYSLYLTFANPTAAFFSPLSRVWELGVGGALSVLLPQRRSADPSLWDQLASIAGFTLLLAATFAMNGQQFPGFKAILPVLGASLLIAAHERSFLSQRILASRGMVAIGLISYPLYLWHWLALSSGRILEGGSLTPLQVGYLLSLAVFLSWLTYEFVEKPVRFGRWAKSGGVIGVLLALLVLIAGMGEGISAKGGFPNRSQFAEFSKYRENLTRAEAKDPECSKMVERLVGEFQFDYCRARLAEGGPLLLVIGDSHAHAIFPGLSEVAFERRISTLVLANSSCPPLLGVTTGATSREHSLCAEKIRQIVAAAEGLAKSGEFKLHSILFVSRGAIYLTGLNYGAGASSGRLELLGDLRAGWRATLDRLTAIPANLGILMEPPEIDTPIEGCLPRPFRLSDRPLCRMNKDQMTERQGPYRNLVQEIAGSYAQKITLLDPMAGFCANGMCSVFGKNGELLYSDSNHLSRAGGRFVAEDVLRDFLAGLESSR